MQTSLLMQAAQLSFPPSGSVEGAMNRDLERLPGNLQCGAYSCSKCGCKEFEGNGQQCENSSCGHAYADHWAIKN